MVNLTEFYIIYKKGKSENSAHGRSSVGVLLLCVGVDLQNDYIFRLAADGRSCGKVGTEHKSQERNCQ